MVELKVVDRVALIQKLSNMRYESLSELQLRHVFLSLCYTIQIEEEGDNDAVQTDCGEFEQSTESN